MRALFLSVCLLNILFFFWELHKGGLNPPMQQQTTALPSILLANEVQHARDGAAISGYLDQDLPVLDKPGFELPPAPATLILPPVETKADETVQTQPEICYEAGPFDSSQAAIQWLATKSLPGEPFTKDTLTPFAFLVYYPAAKNPEQMRINRMMLNAKGISDVWVVPSGDLKGALSLGLFNDEPRAALFKKQLAQRGVQAEIKGRYKSQPRFFVKFQSDMALPTNQDIHLEAVACSPR